MKSIETNNQVGTPHQGTTSISEPVSRRSFLKGSGLAAIGVTTASTVGLAACTAKTSSSSLNYRQSFPNLGSDNGRSLVRMARDIFPHDKLADEYYAAAVVGYDEKALNDNELKALVLDGIARLDQEASKRHGKRYTEIALEQERLEVLYAIENTPFFQKIKGGLVTGLYNNKAVWAQLGYEGSSWEKGGYLNRGFNDIKWL